MTIFTTDKWKDPQTLEQMALLNCKPFKAREAEDTDGSKEATRFETLHCWVLTSK